MIFTSIHGLTWDDVCHAPTFEAVWPEILRFTEGLSDFVAHNASFDRKVLEACCKSYNLEPLSSRFHCSVQIARKAFGIYPTKLSNVCKVLGIDLNHHEALSDARACAQIVIRAREKTLSSAF